MTIDVADERNTVAWDDFIGGFSSAGPLHTQAWTECFRNERLTPLYLRLLSEGRPIGGIAGVIVDPPLALLRLIDRKILFFSGPALADMSGPRIRDSMLSLKRYAEARRLTSLISLARDYPHTYDWGGSRVHLQTIHEYIVDLRGGWDDVEAKMRKSIPEQARKAERAGVTFHEHRDASMLPQLCALLENTQDRRMRKSGVRFSPFYLPHLAETPVRRLAASSIARFFVARRGTQTQCVLLVFAFCRRAYALWIGCSEEGYECRAPAFVWFHAMRVLAAAGTESLNLAGAGPKSTVAFAKASLGAKQHACTGSVSPYLQGPVRNLLFQVLRWMSERALTSPLSAESRSSGA